MNAGIPAGFLFPVEISKDFFIFHENIPWKKMSQYDVFHRGQGPKNLKTIYLAFPVFALIFFHTILNTLYDTLPGKGVRFTQKCLM